MLKVNITVSMGRQPVQTVQQVQQIGIFPSNTKDVNNQAITIRQPVGLLLRRAWHVRPVLSCDELCPICKLFAYPGKYETSTGATSCTGGCLAGNEMNGTPFFYYYFLLLFKGTITP